MVWETRAEATTFISRRATSGSLSFGTSRASSAISWWNFSGGNSFAKSTCSTGNSRAKKSRSSCQRWLRRSSGVDGLVKTGAPLLSAFDGLLRAAYPPRAISVNSRAADTLRIRRFLCELAAIRDEYSTSSCASGKMDKKGYALSDGGRQDVLLRFTESRFSGTADNSPSRRGGSLPGSPNGPGLAGRGGLATDE